MNGAIKKQNDYKNNYKAEVLRLLRNQWFSFIQWTAAISALLITTEILIFTKGNINDCSKYLFCASVLILLANIVTCWIVVKSAIFKIYKKEYETGEVSQDDIRKIENQETVILTIFIIGIALFALFFLSIFLKEVL